MNNFIKLRNAKQNSLLQYPIEIVNLVHNLFPMTLSGNSYKNNNKLYNNPNYLFKKLHAEEA